MTKVKASTILMAIARRHKRDLFLTEVKTGRTWYNEDLLRLDAVAVKKSWKHPCITVYEVKVDRQDFLRDDKWHGYMNYGHQMYFACPKGIVKANELPPEVGLMVYNPERDTIRVQRKAQFRDVELPTELLYYIALSRVDSDRYPFYNSKREFFEDWLANKESNRELGVRVRNKMASELHQLAYDLDRAQHELKEGKQQARYLSGLASIIDTHIGTQSPLCPRSYRPWDPWSWEQYLNNVEEVLTTGVSAQIAAAVENLEDGLCKLKGLVGIEQEDSQTQEVVP